MDFPAPFCSELLHWAKLLTAAFGSRAPIQAAPTQATAPGLKASSDRLACWVCTGSAAPPAHPLPHPSPSLASLPQLYGWHMEAISIYPLHQDAASCCAPASGILRVPAGPFRRLHAKQPAVCRERLGPLHQCRGGLAICAHGSSWAVCVSDGGGPCSVRVWVVVLCPAVFHSFSGLCSPITLWSCPWALGQGSGRSSGEGTTQLFSGQGRVCLLSLIFKKAPCPGHWQWRTHCLPLGNVPRVLNANLPVAECVPEPRLLWLVPSSGCQSQGHCTSTACWDPAPQTSGTAEAKASCCPRRKLGKASPMTVPC